MSAITVAVLAISAATAGSAWAAPPANDDFASPQVLTGSLPISVPGTNVDATTEPNEPSHDGEATGASVWYSWTPAATGVYIADSCPTAVETVLAVYTGTAFENLLQVGDRIAGCHNTGIKRFFASSGETYHIAVAGLDEGGGPSQGSFTLGLSQVPPPANDDLAAAQLVAGSAPISVDSTNVAATKEIGEPNHAGEQGGASVWFRWTPAVASTYRIETCGSGLSTALAAYTGDSYASLSEVASDDDGTCDGSRVEFAASTGTEYKIAVDGDFIAFLARPAMAEFQLKIEDALAPPANDDFADRETLEPDLPFRETDNFNATKEPGEPNHGGNVGGASIWYQWTAPETGLYRVNHCLSGIPVVAGVYTGSSLAGLSTVPFSVRDCSELNGGTRFGATGGQTYQIALDGLNEGLGAAEGAFSFQVSPLLPPNNDTFSFADTLSGASDQRSTNNDFATKETGEPNHAGDLGGASLWYRWTAPTSGGFEINTCASDIDTLLAVYTGGSVDSLAPVVSNDDACGTRSSVRVSAIQGTTYNIAVDGKRIGGAAATGPIEIEVDPAGPPANDNFASAQSLAGSPIDIVADNSGATVEVGEPNHGGDPAGASVWFNWTAPATAMTTIDTCGATFDTVLAVYTGDSVSTLFTQGIADHGCGLASSLELAATAGQTYRIAVDGISAGGVASQGTFPLSIEDISVPETTITAGPPRRTTKRRVTFRFISSEPLSTFECKLDNGVFQDCASPHKTRRLKFGRHRFEVRAIDGAGNVDPTPAAKRFRVIPP